MYIRTHVTLVADSTWHEPVVTYMDCWFNIFLLMLRSIVDLYLCTVWYFGLWYNCMLQSPETTHQHLLHGAYITSSSAAPYLTFLSIVSKKSILWFLISTSSRRRCHDCVAPFHRLHLSSSAGSAAAPPLVRSQRHCCAHPTPHHLSPILQVNS